MAAKNEVGPGKKPRLHYRTFVLLLDHRLNVLFGWAGLVVLLGLLLEKPGWMMHGAVLLLLATAMITFAVLTRVIVRLFG